MLMVVYEAGIDEDLSGVLDEAHITGYTKLTGATGTGRKGHRFGTQIWPGTNNLLWIALPDGDIAGLLKRLDALKGSYLKPPALQTFIFPVEIVE
jgi:hypothetical protein